VILPASVFEISSELRKKQTHRQTELKKTLPRDCCPRG